MPPLTKNPDSFYALKGSDEDRDFMSQARGAVFDVWDASTPESSYHVYITPEDLPQFALGALVDVVRVKGEGSLTAQKASLQPKHRISVKNVFKN